MQWQGSFGEGCRRRQSQTEVCDKKPADKEKGMNVLSVGREDEGKVP